MPIKTKAIPANMYRYFLSEKTAPVQAKAVAKDVHFNSIGYDFDKLATILDIAINIKRMFKMVFIKLVFLLFHFVV